MLRNWFFFATLIKSLLRKKVLFASFITLQPTLFNLWLIFLVLKLFCFECFFYSSLKHWKLFNYWFFFLIFLYFNIAFLISICISVFSGAHFFFFYVLRFFVFFFFYCYSTFLNITYTFFLPFGCRISFASHVSFDIY